MTDYFVVSSIVINDSNRGVYPILDRSIVPRNWIIDQTKDMITIKHDKNVMMYIWYDSSPQPIYLPISAGYYEFSVGFVDKNISIIQFRLTESI